MFGRSVRVACLAIAAWAVLFAPGAAGTGVSTDAPGASRADQVAAAVLAPTFEVDSVARSPRSCTESVADERVQFDTVSRHVSMDEEVVVEAIAVIRPPLLNAAQSGRRACVSLRGPPES